MKYLLLLAGLSLTNLSFAEEKSSVQTVSLITSQISLNLECDWEAKRKGKGQYHCWKSDIEEAAKVHAAENNGQFIGYTITSAPKGFYTGQWERETRLMLEVRYLK